MRRKFRASSRRPLLEFEGKPVARVVAWDSVREKTASGAPRAIVPKRSITDPRQVPKGTKTVWIVVFNKAGHRIEDRYIPRSELKNYVLVP
jgi:hypothetical protein